jgi:Ca2+-binding EF-hand superfamily protein
MKKVIISIACIAAAGTVLADAAKNFERADTDKDGVMSKKEFFAMRKGWAEKKGEEFDEAKTAKFFDNKDANEDGKLTLEEFSTGSK